MRQVVHTGLRVLWVLGFLACTLVFSSTDVAAVELANVAPVSAGDAFVVNEDESVVVPVLANDADADNTLTVVGINGNEVGPGSKVNVENGLVSVNSDGALSVVPDPNFHGSMRFSYTTAELVAVSSAGVSFHIESSASSSGLYMIDLATAAKTYLGSLPVANADALAYDQSTGYLYLLSDDGGIWSLNAADSTANARLIGNVEAVDSGWTDPVPAEHRHHSAAFHKGSLYLAPSSGLGGPESDVLFRVDFASPTVVNDVASLGSISGGTAGWNEHFDITIDPGSSMLYGTAASEVAGGQRRSQFYSFDLKRGRFALLSEVVSSGSAGDRVGNDFRRANAGLVAPGDGDVYGASASGEIGRLEQGSGEWSLLGAYALGSSSAQVADISLGGRFMRTTEAIVEGTVESVNDAPVANDDVISTGFNTAVEINPMADSGLGADEDPDGHLDPSSVALLSPPDSLRDEDGSLRVAGEGTRRVDPETGLITFVPAAGFSGTVAIGYTVSDDQGLVSNDAQISVSVMAGSATFPIDAEVPRNLAYSDQPVASTPADSGGLGLNGWLMLLLLMGLTLTASGAARLGWLARRFRREASRRAALEKLDEALSFEQQVIQDWDGGQVSPGFLRYHQRVRSASVDTAEFEVSEPKI